MPTENATYKPLNALPPEHLLTVQEASYYLKIHPRTMDELIQKNGIPYHRVGWRTIRIEVADLLEFLDRTRVPAKSDLPQSRKGLVTQKRTARTKASDIRDFLNQIRVPATAVPPPLNRKSNVSDSQVAEIRKLRESGATLISIAETFNITESSASRICAGNRRQKDLGVRMVEA